MEDKDLQIEELKLMVLNEQLQKLQAQMLLVKLDLERQKETVAEMKQEVEPPNIPSVVGE